MNVCIGLSCWLQPMRLGNFRFWILDFGGHLKKPMNVCIGLSYWLKRMRSGNFRFWILDFGGNPRNDCLGVRDVDENEFKRRTKTLALRVIRLAEALPRKVSTDVMSKQLIRCATSVGANYRSACRAKSTADLIAKLSIVEEEADECLYWLELLVAADAIAEAKVKSLITEVNEIVAITVASIKTLRRKQSNPKSKI